MGISLEFLFQTWFVVRREVLTNHASYFDSNIVSSTILVVGPFAITATFIKVYANDLNLKSY